MSSILQYLSWKCLEFWSMRRNWFGSKHGTPLITHSVALFMSQHTMTLKNGRSPSSRKSFQDISSLFKRLISSWFNRSRNITKKIALQRNCRKNYRLWLLLMIKQIWFALLTFVSLVAPKSSLPQTCKKKSYFKKKILHWMNFTTSFKNLSFWSNLVLTQENGSTIAIEN